MIKNIYKEFGEYCDQRPGLIPVLFFENINKNQISIFKKNKETDDINPVEMERVIFACFDQDGKKTGYNMIVFAENLADACDVFRKKTRLNDKLNRAIGSGGFFEVYGIMADGDICGSGYHPMLKVCCYDKKNLERILAISNEYLCKINAWCAVGKLKENGVATIGVSRVANHIKTYELVAARKTMFNRVYDEISPWYHVVRLDELGGYNQENVNEFLTNSSLARLNHEEYGLALETVKRCETIDQTLRKSDDSIAESAADAPESAEKTAVKIETKTKGNAVEKVMKEVAWLDAQTRE